MQSEKPEELPDLVVQERRRDQSAKRQVRNFFSVLNHLAFTDHFSGPERAGERDIVIYMSVCLFALTY